MENAVIRYAEASKTRWEGPDQILPTKADRTWDRDGRVRIKLNPLENQAEMYSIPGVLTRISESYANREALITRLNEYGQHDIITYKEYSEQVRAVAKAFLSLGLKRYHSVCILGFNSPEWFIAYLAAIHAGGFAVGLFTTYTAEECKSRAETSRANIIVVEDDKQMAKIMQIRHTLPDLKCIIKYDGTNTTASATMSWSDLLNKGMQVTDNRLECVLKTIGINECCSLVYTAGTTGDPKAVMLSHDNLLSNARALLNGSDLTKGVIDVFVSYLPLAEVTVQVMDIIASMIVGGTVHFAERDALTKSLITTLPSVRPTLFMGEPHIWEKIFMRMLMVSRTSSPFKRKAIKWAKDHALRYYTNRMNGVDHKTLSYLCAKKMFLDKTKKLLGLDRSTLLTTAPLSTQMIESFLKSDMQIRDCYGLSESSGAHSVTPMTKFKLFGVGKTLPEFATRLINVDNNGEGEICAKGRHIFMGYLNEPEKTREAKDEFGWLHTGDLGKIDADDILYVLAKINDLIITTGGDRIAPADIEELVKQECPAISNCMIVGHERKFLTLLIALKTEINPDTGVPKDSLSIEALNWVRTMGSNATSVSECISFEERAKIRKGIMEAITRVNQKTATNVQRVQKFQIIPRDFSVATGELGPTLKLRRHVVAEKYKIFIEEMYKEF